MGIDHPFHLLRLLLRPEASEALLVSGQYPLFFYYLPPCSYRPEIKNLETNVLRISYATVTSFHTSRSLYRCDSQPKISPSSTSAVPGCHVFWPWSFCDRIHHSWTYDSRLGGPEPQNEPGLDGIDGRTKSNRRCSLCR